MSFRPVADYAFRTYLLSHGHRPEGLSGSYIAHMHLYHGHFAAGYSVAQAVRIVRQCTGVHHYTIAFTHSLLYLIYKRPLMVALEALQLRAMGCSDIPALFLYVGKRRPPVYLSLPPARKVEIRACVLLSTDGSIKLLISKGRNE